MLHSYYNFIICENLIYIQRCDYINTVRITFDVKLGQLWDFDIMPILLVNVGVYLLNDC